jgi:DNA repair exonuclease SbcCD ATPase subunit
MNIAELRSRLDALDSSLKAEEGTYNYLKTSVSNMKKDLSGMADREVLLRKCIVVIQRLADLKKEETTKKVERLVSFGLQTVFANNTYQFHIQSEVTRDNVNYTFTVERDGVETDIIESSGGGVVNVVSFLLRLIIVLFSRGQRRVLILDEPFSNLSENYHENLGKLLGILSKRTGVQIIMVSHQPKVEPEDARVYTLTKEGANARAT